MVIYKFYLLVKSEDFPANFLLSVDYYHINPINKQSMPFLSLQTCYASDRGRVQGGR
jgi:hypothetical protein